jgi:dephospho-CoA kinase
VLLVGLTGGIGAGKSTVAGLLRERGAEVVDADAVARAVVEPGRPALAALAEHFGAGILRPDGSLDRAALADLAFVDDESRRALEAITHPAIRAEMERRLAEARDGEIVVVEVQLLVETWAGRIRDYDAVVVVEASPETRIARLVERGMSADDAARRMAAQATDEERRTIATHVVGNDGDVAALAQQVDEVWADLQRRLAATPSSPPE